MSQRVHREKSSYPFSNEQRVSNCTIVHVRFQKLQRARGQVSFRRFGQIVGVNRVIVAIPTIFLALFQTRASASMPAKRNLWMVRVSVRVPKSCRPPPRTC